MQEYIKDALNNFKAQAKTTNDNSRNEVNSLANRKTVKDFLTFLEGLAEQEKTSVESLVSDLGAYAAPALKEALPVIEDFGGEGQGDNYYKVIQWNNQYWLIPGWYSSYEGGEYNVDDSYEVYPSVKITLDFDKL